MEKTLLDQKSLFHNPFLELTYQKNLFIFQVPFYLFSVSVQNY